VKKEETGIQVTTGSKMGYSGNQRNLDELQEQMRFMVLMENGVQEHRRCRNNGIDGAIGYRRNRNHGV